MKNLSKVLALVLSLAFVLTMFAGAVSYPNAAEYSDADTLSDNGAEAVAFLSTLGIITGYADGTFQGDANVQRTHYATMIARASGESQKALKELFNVNAMEFSDVTDGAWYIPYCMYALHNGIMVGYGNGQLKPTANVTGYEALKMTLVALGYDPTAEGLVGVYWKNNTIKLAGAAGLLKNLDANVGEALTREDTAIIIYNALFADTVSYTGGHIVYGETLGEKAYGIKAVSAAAVTKVTAAAEATVEFGAYSCTFASGEEPNVGGTYDLVVADRYQTIGEDDLTVMNEKAIVVSYNKVSDPAATAAVYGKVLSIAEKDGVWTVKVAGMTKAVTLYFAPDFAKGDMIQVIENGAWFDVKAATTFVGLVVGYTDNSSDEWYDDAAIGDTVKSGEKDYYTIQNVETGAEANYTLAVDELNAKELAYFEELMGYGSAAVNDVVLEYTVVGNKIYNVKAVDETYWANYAIVIDTGDDEYLGMDAVRLYTDDNEYKDYYVASFNGNQIYNSLLTWDDFGEDLINALVRYYVLSDNTIALYTADYVNGNTLYDDDKLMTYDADEDLWYGYDYDGTDVQGATAYTWDNATVFVSYDWQLWDITGERDIADNGNEDAPTVYIESNKIDTLQWRAYKVGEFQPKTTEEVSLDRADEAEIVYVDGLNNVSELKAAAIRFDNNTREFVSGYWYNGEFYSKEVVDALVSENLDLYTEIVNNELYVGYVSFGDYYYLPGLVLRDNEIFATIMAKTSVKMVDGKYQYTVTYLGTDGENKTATLTTTAPENTMIVGDIYKLFLNDDGTIRRWEVAATAATLGNWGFWADTNDYEHGSEATTTTGSDYLELRKLTVNAIIDNGDGTYKLQIKNPYVAVEKDGILTFTVETYWIYINADTDMYFTEGLFTTDIKAYDPDLFTTSLGYMDFRTEYEVYADINASTNEVYSIWFNKGEDMYSESIVLKDIPVSALYDEDAREITYTIGINGIETNVITVEDADVTDLLIPADNGQTYDCDITAKYDAETGKWFIEDDASVIASDFEWETITKKDALNLKFVDLDGTGEYIFGVEVTDKLSDEYYVSPYVVGWLYTVDSFETAIDPIFYGAGVSAEDYDTYAALAGVIGNFQTGVEGSGACMDWRIEAQDYDANNADDTKYISFESVSILVDGDVVYGFVFNDAEADVSNAFAWPYATLVS